MKDEFSTHILEPYSAPIAEMADNPDKSDEFAIEVDTSKVENILKRDKNPMFVTLPVACEGKSVNGRNYTAENVESIVEQINKDHPDRCRAGDRTRLLSVSRPAGLEVLLARGFGWRVVH